MALDVEQRVNDWIRDACERGASDIHFEPERGDRLRVRMRVDGNMTLVEAVAEGRKVLSRLKLMAELDTNEKNVSMDGRIDFAKHEAKYAHLDLRLNTMPCLFGEKAVLRLIDNRRLRASLDELGFTNKMLGAYKRLVDTPHGLVLHVGPTGSGKTTSLYALMKTLHKREVNIQTVEDPIEYALDGITQTQVNHEQGLNFPTVLRGLLRQDPDILMVGEIRDSETAEIAVEAAMTGHLVLSTLHTNDAVGTVVRLLEFGIAPYCIAYSLRSVVCQRFVRVLCTKCRKKTETNDTLARLLGRRATIYEPDACSNCYRTGYRGRVPLFELLPMTAALRNAVYTQVTPDGLQGLAAKNGLISLWQDGVDKILAGVTSLEEVLRVAKGVRDPSQHLRTMTSRLGNPAARRPGPKAAGAQATARRPVPRAAPRPGA